jgi:anti-sigma factor RsiW
MQHFDITRWTDYVRGLAPEVEREAMERHLAGGCDTCARLSALVGRIHQQAEEEPVVPGHLVIAAKSIFPLRRVEEAPRWRELPRLAARLLFDSMAGPVQEGARSASPAVVQTVYHAGDYAIEMQMERDGESTEMALVGQVVNRADSGKPVRGATVWVLARNRQVARIESNQFGEFCLTVKAQPGLKLCVALEEIGHRVEIPLVRITGGGR